MKQRRNKQRDCHKSFLFILSLMFSDVEAISCFKNNEELANAVNLYLTGKNNNETIDELSSKYGWPIGKWCVGSVTNFTSIFESAKDFDEDLADWDTSNALEMTRMFHGATTFNQPLGSWDVSKVQKMESMFQDASSFDQDLPWNMSSVISIKSMFENAVSFNGQIARWNVDDCQDLRRAFFGASSFNVDVSMWDVPPFAQLDNIFGSASSFRQDLCGWGLTYWSDDSFDEETIPIPTGRNLFVDTNCPIRDDPNWQQLGPFCYECPLFSEAGQSSSSPFPTKLFLHAAIKLCAFTLVMIFGASVAYLVQKARENVGIDPMDHTLNEFELLKVIEER